MKLKKKFQWNIKIPDNITFRKQDDYLFFKGPLGTNKIALTKIDPNGDVAFMFKPNSILFCSESKPFFRTFTSLLTNKINGVTRGYLVRLRISGVGYRCILEKTSVLLQDNKESNNPIIARVINQPSASQILRFKVGFSHDLIFKIPRSIKAFLMEPTLLCLYGIEKNQVTQIASKIRDIQSPSIYKGKGISFSEEVIKLKQGKRK